MALNTLSCSAVSELASLLDSPEISALIAELDASRWNVKGLSLPSAEEQLNAAGYKASVTTQALFGVIVKSHYTVCSEGTPDGKLVPIKVEKKC
jgi:hypothetical protein